MISENKAEMDLKRVLYRLNPIPTHTEKFRESESIVFYIKGGHRFDFGDYTLDTAEGNMLYIPYGSVYTNEVTSENTEYFQVDFNFLNEGTPGRMFDRAKVFDAEQSLKYLPLFREMYDVYSGHGITYGVFCMSILLKMAGMIFSDDLSFGVSSGGIGKIENTLNHLNEFYYLSTSAEELAAMSSMSVSNMEKTFKNKIGMSPIAYRHTIRIDHAKLLLAGGYSISDTAERVGYSDVYYFSRIFKKYSGVTPGAFARENKGL